MSSNEFCVTTWETNPPNWCFSRTMKRLMSKRASCSPSTVKGLRGLQSLHPLSGPLCSSQYTQGAGGTGAEVGRKVLWLRQHGG